MPSIEELQLLNYVLETKDWDVIAREELDEDYFPVHREAFEFVKSFKKDYGELPTLETVLNRFEEFEVVEVENVDAVVSSLKEDWLHRKFRPVMVKSAELMADKKTTEAIQEIRNYANQILKQIGSGVKGYSYVGMAERRKEDYLKIHGRKEDEILGYTTGFKPLDVATNGLEYGDGAVDYFLVLAPSNMGKTLISSFMLQSAWSSTLDDDYPAYFALEQRASEIAYNWDNVLAGVSRLAMTRGTMSEEMKDRYIDFLDRLTRKKKDMMIYDIEANGGKPYSIDDIYRILEYEGHNRFTIDQLSKVALKTTFWNMDLRQRLFEVSAEVRNMILDLKVPAYVVAQANRESARRVKKSLEEGELEGEDVGETYSIFQDASKGISIIKINDNTFKIMVTKNRNNSTGQSFLVRYNFETGLVNVLNDEIGEQYF